MEAKRLELLGSLVDSTNVFDVGCDHALLSIYLSTNHNVTASDISISSIKKAEDNVKKCKSNVKVVLSDGLDELNIGKNDDIVIAGMGTSTILKILKKNINKLSNTIIIQSNNNLDTLRKEMVKLGYYIDREVSININKYYVMIRFKKGYRKYKYIDYIVGINPSKEYIEYTIRRYNKMLSNI